MMNLNSVKKIFLSPLLMTGLMLAPIVAGPVLAVQSTASAQLQATRMANLKARADTEINRRVTSLSGLISLINANKRISASDKASFTSDISSQIASLNALKVKIDADTDPTTLVDDVQSIVTSYRVFLLYIPKIHILVAADAMSTVAGTLSTLAGKLQTRITQAQQAGKDVSAMQASLNDMLAKIADAKNQYANAESTVTPLVPSGYPGNKPQLIAARADIVNGANDLKAALADAKSIIAALKALASGSSASSSATH